jgi:hypothetical protein
MRSHCAVPTQPRPHVCLHASSLRCWRERYVRGLAPRVGCQRPYDRNAVAGMSETHPPHLMSQVHVRNGWAYEWDTAKICPKRISVPEPMSEMVWHADGAPRRYVRNAVPRPEPMSEMVGIRTGHYKDMSETYFSVPNLCPKWLTHRRALHRYVRNVFQDPNLYPKCTRPIRRRSCSPYILHAEPQLKRTVFLYVVSQFPLRGVQEAARVVAG